MIQSHNANTAEFILDRVWYIVRDYPCEPVPER